MRVTCMLATRARRDNAHLALRCSAVLADASARAPPRAAAPGGELTSATTKYVDHRSGRTTITGATHPVPTARCQFPEKKVSSRRLPASWATIRRRTATIRTRSRRSSTTRGSRASWLWKTRQRRGVKLPGPSQPKSRESLDHSSQEIDMQAGGQKTG
eukprot:3025573-Prymnesium_polylepis.1